MTVSIEVVEYPVTVTVEGETTVIEATTEVATLEVGTSGPQGATGAVGPVGPPGTQPVFSKTGPLEAVVGTHRFYLEQNRTISKVRAAVGTASVGAPIVIDVKKNGVSIFGGTPLSVSAGQFTNTKNTNEAVVAGDYLTIDIVSVGTSTAGSDLTVTVTLD